AVVDTFFPPRETSCGGFAGRGCGSHTRISPSGSMIHSDPSGPPRRPRSPGFFAIPHSPEPTMFRGAIFTIALLIGVPGTLNAQQPIVDSLRWLFERTSGNVIATAEMLQENVYDYRPTPEVRTAGEILAHIAFSQFQFCAA